MAPVYPNRFAFVFLQFDLTIMKRTRCDGQLPYIRCRNRKAFCEYKDSGRRRGPKKTQEKLMAAAYDPTTSS